MRRLKKPREGFNPTLVRLRPAPGRPRGWRPSRFNPTLVRLRPFRVGLLIQAVMLFQSHAGSIEAIPGGVAHPGGDVVSIPRWFD